MSAPYPDQNQGAYPNPAYQQPQMQQPQMQSPYGTQQMSGQSPYGTQPLPMQQMPGQMPYNPQMPPQMASPQQQQQPGAEQWMPIPQGIQGCPPGLEYLTQIDQLLVKQKVEIFEVMTNIETANKYKIKNSMGQDVYKAKEKSNFCTRQCCGPIRCFQMEITDNTGREVLHLDRPLNCATCCFPCCLQKLTVTSPITGEVLGLIKQKWHPFLPVFEICDANENVVLKMEGPFCAVSCCGDVNFEIKTKNDESVGKITKQWSGFAKEAFTDADNFGITFPLDLDVKVKAVLVGAVFLIDFMFFEQAQDQQQSTQWG